jgi:small subunit ribosomal protein S20
MPQHASAKKRMLTSERDRQRNRAVKSQVRRAVKDMRETIGSEEAPEQLSTTHSVLDKASKKGVIHPKRVDRIKSRLAKAAHKATKE